MLWWSTFAITVTNTDETLCDVLVKLPYRNKSEVFFKDGEHALLQFNFPANVPVNMLWDIMGLKWVSLTWRSGIYLGPHGYAPETLPLLEKQGWRSCG